MRRIPTRCLKKDSVIATDVYDGDFKLLIKKNSKVNERTIEALKRFNIMSVYVIDEYSSEVFLDIDGEKSVKEIGEILDYKYGMQIHPLYERLLLFLNHINVNLHYIEKV